MGKNKEILAILPLKNVIDANPGFYFKKIRRVCMFTCTQYFILPHLKFIRILLIICKSHAFLLC